MRVRDLGSDVFMDFIEEMVPTDFSKHQKLFIYKGDKVVVKISEKLKDNEYVWIDMTVKNNNECEIVFDGVVTINYTEEWAKFAEKNDIFGNASTID